MKYLILCSFTIYISSVYKLIKIPSNEFFGSLKTTIISHQKVTPKYIKFFLQYMYIYTYRIYVYPFVNKFKSEMHSQANLSSQPTIVDSTFLPLTGGQHFR